MSTIIFAYSQISFDKAIILCYRIYKGGMWMVSYKPLWHTLIEKGIKKMELVKLVGMSSSTLAKLNNDNYVALEVIDRICQALDCRIEDVVEIKKNPGN